jgi:hypothetical protein
MVTLAYDENSATVGNGIMVALAAKNREVSRGESRHVARVALANRNVTRHRRKGVPAQRKT